MQVVFNNRPTWLEIDVAAFRSNLRVVKEQSGTAEVWAVVKANAYQHGVEALFPFFVAEEVKNFCVSQFDEAVFLQQIADKYGVDIKILIMGDVDSARLASVQPNWRITISRVSQVDAALASLEQRSMPILVHLKVDSGMNRRGVKTRADVNALYQAIQRSSCLTVEGAYTHFATADGDKEVMQAQYDVFMQQIEDMRQQLSYVHCANSNGLFELEDTKQCLNMVRPGAILYGLGGNYLGIQPIAALYSRIDEVKAIQAGEKVSYGHTYTCEQSGYLAVLPIGYADGWWRSNQGRHVYCANAWHPIVGRVCMEQLMIFSETPFQRGAQVEFFGKKRTIQDVASDNQTIDYEIMCSMSNRIPRKYVTGKETTSCDKEHQWDHF